MGEVSIRVLLVEDEPDVRSVAEAILHTFGYTVTAVANGAEALDAMDEAQPDLILSDIRMPVFDGFQLLQRIRADPVWNQTPFIILSAKAESADLRMGMSLGADDYVTKPYSSRELLARIRAILRRRVEDEVDSESVLEAGTVRMDTERHTVAVSGKETKMPLKEFELLEVLLRNAGRVLTRGQLIDRVWGADYYGDTKTLDVHIKRIRSRIETNPSEPTMLLTVRGLGYRFES